MALRQCRRKPVFPPPRWLSAAVPITSKPGCVRRRGIPAELNGYNQLLEEGEKGEGLGPLLFREGREGGSPPFPRKSRIPQEVRRRRERETSSSMFPLPGSVVAKASYPFHLSLPNVVGSFRRPSPLLFSFPFPPLNRKKVCSGKKVEPEGRRGLHCANRVLNFAKASPPLFLLDPRSCSERKGERTPLCLRSKRVEKRAPTEARRRKLFERAKEKLIFSRKRRCLQTGWHGISSIALSFAVFCTFCPSSCKFRRQKGENGVKVTLGLLMHLSQLNNSISIPPPTPTPPPAHSPGPSSSSPETQKLIANSSPPLLPPSASLVSRRLLRN